MPMVDTDYGVNPQAIAVMHFLHMHDGVEGSWNKDTCRYDATVHAAPWYNGRERGIVFYCLSADYKRQINIAVFEHRNSDEICAVKFLTGSLLNPPTLADIPAGIYETKYDVSCTARYGMVGDMASYVYAEIESFWESTKC